MDKVEQWARELLAEAEGGPANDHGMVPRHIAHAAIATALASQAESGGVRELALQLVDEVDDLVGETHGVYGLHLNGDPSPWGELLPGGRFERLSSLNELRAALSQQPEARGVADDAMVERIIARAERETNIDGMDGDRWDRILVRAALTGERNG